MSAPLLVLDTGPVVGIATRSPLGQSIISRHFVTQPREKPLISIVTVAECHSSATHNGWGRKKLDQLDTLLGEFTIVDITANSPLIPKYAEIYAHLRAEGRNWTTNQNDMWIASLAAVAKATLITTDFKLGPLLTPRFLQVETYHPRTGELVEA